MNTLYITGRRDEAMVLIWSIILLKGCRPKFPLYIQHAHNTQESKLANKNITFCICIFLRALFTSLAEKIAKPGAGYYPEEDEEDS